MKFKKVCRGHYVTEDGKYAAVIDGLEYIKVADRDGAGVDAGVFGGEWSARFDDRGRLAEDTNAGSVIHWGPTKKEAVEACQRHAGRN